MCFGLGEHWQASCLDSFFVETTVSVSILSAVEVKRRVFLISSLVPQETNLQKKMKFFVVLIALVLLLYTPTSKCEQNKDGMVAYIKASLPNQIYRCIQRFNILRCLKYFVLLRLESRDYTLEPSNSTSEFLENILKSEQNLPREIPENITQLSDDDLNERLTEGFQRFFDNRPIKLHFIPNMLVRVVPNRSNDLEVSLKKIVNSQSSSAGRKLDEATKAEDVDSDDYYDDDTKEEKDENVIKDDKGDMKKDEKEKGSGMRKKQSYYLQLGIPFLLTPYMVFAGFLPMLIPVLKLATAFTTIVNLAALIGSVMYLARQHALEREMQQTVYFNPGYKERK